MRKSLRVSVLMLALCCPVLAGDILCPPRAADAAITDEATDTRLFAQIVLNLLALI